MFGLSKNGRRTPRASTRQTRASGYSRAGGSMRRPLTGNGRTTQENSNAGLKAAVNNEFVSGTAARSARAQLKLNHVPKRDIPKRKLSTRIKRIGVKLGLKKHSGQVRHS